MWQCPACCGGSAHETHRLGVAEAALSFVRPQVDQARYNELLQRISELWSADEVSLRRCDECGLRSADPFVAGDARFYELAFGRESVHPYPASRWEYGLTEAVITSTTGTVLEIGSGEGAFQRSIIAKGVAPSRLFATEFSSRGHRALTALGVSFAATDFRELPPASHAVVCGHQVFEHLDRLDEAFDAFDRLTAPGGTVAVSVPNGKHIDHGEAAGGLIDMPPTHVSTWRFTSFDAIARRRGWKIADYREEPISRFRSAKELAISRTFQARTRSRSFPAFAERLSPTSRARYLSTAAAAAMKFPSAYRESSERCGGSVWVAMTRA